MNHQHPYGGYDAGPNNRSAPHEAGYGGAAPQGGGYYPPPAPPQHHMQQQRPPPPPQQQAQHYPPHSPAMNGQNDYQGGAARDYRDASSYPLQSSHDYRPNAPPGMSPNGGRDGRMGSAPALTLGSGPLNSQSQYGGPIRYDGANASQSPSPSMQGHNPYGSPYSSDNAANLSRPLPPPMRQQAYGSVLPPKPASDSAPMPYQSMPPRPPLGSPPSHLPRPPGREWNGDQPAKRARRDGGYNEDEKVPDKVIAERIKRERPCRTLFVRNVEFNADIEDLRKRFEAFGEIKSWFDLTSKRGLLFISYFDLRCAEYAKGAMQEFEVNGRKVDVHYSLPREVDMTKRCDRDKDQGTLFVLLKKAQGELNDDELKATFSQFGEIKSLRRYKDQGNCRFLEYYDCRACKAAHDALYGAEWNGGTWDLKYAWDAAAPDRISEKPRREREQQGREGGQGYNYNQEGPGRAPMQQHQQPPPPNGPPRWEGNQGYGPPAPNSAPAYPSYGAPGGSDYRQPPPPPPPSSAGAGPPGASYGTKRPYDYDDRNGAEPPMRRWGQAQGSANAQQQQQQPHPPPPGQYGPPRPEPQGYGAGVDRSPYGGQQGGADYGRYDGGGYGAQQQGPPPHQAAPPPPPPSGPPNRWGAPANGGYGPPPPQLNAPPRPPPPQQQQQPIAPPSAPSNDDRLEQAQKVQQLLASLKPGNAIASKAPNAASPAPAPAAPVATPAAAAVPSLPSNIAALLQMAQANASKK